MAALQQSALAVWVSESVWAYPLILTAHTVGLALLVGGSTLFDLRLLGAAPVASLALWAGAIVAGRLIAYM